MKVRFNRWSNALLSSLLAMLGFASCSSGEEEEYFVPEYGVVIPNIEWRGAVTNEAEAPIQGISTLVKYAIKDYNDPSKVGYYTVDSVSTDANGRFAVHVPDINHLNYKLILQDLDGEANGGTFQSDTLTLTELVAEEISGDNDAPKVYEIKSKIILKK